MPTRRILVVDDDASFVEALTPLLYRAGYEVRAAREGGQALVEMGESHPDLIILDLMMGPVNGWELLASKSQIPSLVGVPAIVVSAYAAVPQPLPSCVKRLFDKPVEPAVVALAVLEVLGDVSADTPH